MDVPIPQGGQGSVFMFGEANGVYGSVDIIARIEGDDLASLVVDEIRSIDGVVDTNTLIVAL